MQTATRQRLKTHKDRKAKARKIAATAHAEAVRRQRETRHPKRRPTFGDALGVGSTMQLAAMAALVDPRPLESWRRGAPATPLIVYEMR